MNIPLNALRAFEVSARHLSFTLAAKELNVTQAAVSAQVKNLEERLNTLLFRRLPRGLALTDEGQALMPMLSESFARMNSVLTQFEKGRVRELLTISAVGSFAVGWLMPRLEAFKREHPFINIRLMTNNNLVNLAGEGLDYAVRFGDGAWHGVHADALLNAAFTPACSPLLSKKLLVPADLMHQTLLRSYRTDEWQHWFKAAKLDVPMLHGPIFDSSLAMASAAIQGFGVALLPPAMFPTDFLHGRLVQPFKTEVPLGKYWLTRLRSRPVSNAMNEFRTWVLNELVI